MDASAKRIEVCSADEVAAGTVQKVEADGLELAVYNLDGAFYVTDNQCTHGPGEMAEGEIVGDLIECNFHGGMFDIRTGEVAGPPCMVPLRTYQVVVEEGKIFILL